MENIIAEEKILGILIRDNASYSDLIARLSPSHFEKAEHQVIYKAIQNMSVHHINIDAETISVEVLKYDNAFQVAHVADLVNKAGSEININYFLNILLHRYITRSLITICRDCIEQVSNAVSTLNPSEILDQTTQKIQKLSEESFKGDIICVRDMISERIEQIQEHEVKGDGLCGIPCGYTAIDSLLLGFQAGELVIVAARPSMGKTAFALTMARNMAVEHNIPVIFFSLEMSGKELSDRLLIAETELSAAKIKGGEKLTDTDWTVLNERIMQLVDGPLYFDTTAQITISELQARARILVRKAGIKIIIVDYLQLVTGDKSKHSSRELEVSSISKALKATAKNLGVTVIALSQLSRAVETRGGDKLPQLSDLRESGAIEQDADLVIFLHRPEYYGTQDDSIPGLTNVMIAKNRNGAIGNVPMRFIKNMVKFTDCETI